MTRPRASRARAQRAARAAALALVAASSVGGCYTSVPVAAPPAPGTTLVLELNDRGRLALGDSIGPAAARIQGVVAAASDSSYALRVASVQYLNGQANRWSGEPLTVRADLLSGVRERRYSRPRTWAVIGGAVAIVAAVALSTDLLGVGTIRREVPTPPPKGQ